MGFEKEDSSSKIQTSIRFKEDLGEGKHTHPTERRVFG